MTELQIMMQGMSEEQRERIHKQADRLEVYFSTNEDVYMKDKDEQWAEGMFDEGESEEYLTKVDKGVQL